MARLKKVRTQAAPEARDPLPEHVRTPAWNGLQQGDPVLIRLPGRKARRGYHYRFSNHVISPGGVEYIDVIEFKAGYGSGLWRSFPPEQVFPVPQPKRRKAA